MMGVVTGDDLDASLANLDHTARADSRAASVRASLERYVQLRWREGMSPLRHRICES